MSIDWIKMRSDLQSHPKVVRILSAVRPQDVLTPSDKFRVIGGLHAVWSIFDKHSIDGKLNGYSPSILNGIIGWEGFAEAMIGVNWLAFDGIETVTVPEFEEHNGSSAKRRAEDQKRKRNARNSSASCPQDVRITSASGPQSVRNEPDNIDAKVGLEKEKEKKEQKKRVNGHVKKDELTLDDWIATLRDDEDAIESDDPLMPWADQVGLPREFIVIAWFEFKRQFIANGKRQKDWRSHFRNAVRRDWLKLWRFNGDTGEVYLTTAGKQAERAMA